jgi:hypothetical protein
MVSLLLLVVDALMVKLHLKLLSLMVYVAPSLSKKVFPPEELVLPPVSTHLAISIRVVVIQLSRLPEIQVDVPILLEQSQLFS